MVQNYFPHRAQQTLPTMERSNQQRSTQKNARKRTEVKTGGYKPAQVHKMASAQKTAPSIRNDQSFSHFSQGTAGREFSASRAISPWFKWRHPRDNPWPKGAQPPGDLCTAQLFDLRIQHNPGGLCFLGEISMLRSHNTLLLFLMHLSRFGS